MCLSSGLIETFAFSMTNVCNGRPLDSLQKDRRKGVWAFKTAGLPQLNWTGAGGYISPSATSWTDWPWNWKGEEILLIRAKQSQDPQTEQVSRPWYRPELEESPAAIEESAKERPELREIQQRETEPRGNLTTGGQAIWHGLYGQELGSH